MSSDTPETDALLLDTNEGRVYDYYGPVADLARKLERRCAALEALAREMANRKDGDYAAPVAYVDRRLQEIKGG